MNDFTITKSGGLDPKLNRLLSAAIRSPSGDNCQPWEFFVENPNRIIIRIISERAKSFFDFKQHGTLLSLGAVIENIRVQAAKDKISIETTLTGKSTNETLGGEVAIELHDEPHLEQDEDTISALYARTVNRRPFLPIRPSDNVMNRILGTPMEGVNVSVIDSFSEILRWSRLIYFADRIRYSHPQIHEELFSKILFSKQMAQEKKIGLEINRLGAGPMAKPLMRLLKPWTRMQKLLRFGVDRVLANHSRFLALATGNLILLTIESDLMEDWVKAGEQMERIWVNAQREGLCIHPMTVALYLDQRYREEGMSSFLPIHKKYLDILRENLKEILPDRTGAIIFRLGYGFRMKDTAIRLPIDSFLKHQGSK